MEQLEKRVYIRKLFDEEGKVLYLGEKKDLHVKDLVQFYKDKSKIVVLEEIEKISQKIGLRPTKISFRKTKKRWGSCNHKNELSFAITLSQLPIECIRYIIVHELTHIKYKNHKKEFYRFIEKVLPDFKDLENIIKNYSPMV